MAYTQKVIFSKTGQYGCVPDHEDDVYTVDEFTRFCADSLFTDYDGSGHPVREHLADPDIVTKPSRLQDIPANATHIVWYNR